MEAAPALERLGGVATAGEVAALSSRQRVRSAVARGEIVTLETGGGHTGTAVGTAIGGAVDVALALTILYANSALGRAGMR